MCTHYIHGILQRIKQEFQDAAETLWYKKICTTKMKMTSEHSCCVMVKNKPFGTPRKLAKTLPTPRLQLLPMATKHPPQDRCGRRLKQGFDPTRYSIQQAAASVSVGSGTESPVASQPSGSEGRRERGSLNWEKTKVAEI